MGGPGLPDARRRGDFRPLERVMDHLSGWMFYVTLPEALLSDGPQR